MSSPRRDHVDPRGPFVLDTRELGRRAGSMRRVQRTGPAPEGWGLELVRIPAGADVVLDLRLEAVMDGVLVSGTAATTIAAECGRCLEPVQDQVEVALQELFAYEPDPGDDEAPVVVGDYLDLEPLVRDTLVIGLPLNPVCRDDCAGLCSGCGERLDELPADHAHDDTDSRWAALAALRTESTASPKTGS